jgi:NADH dehydrogenase FAD-containing subunit
MLGKLLKLDSRLFSLANPCFRQTFSVSKDFDVVVIGGGHAGCEAASGN